MKALPDLNRVSRVQDLNRPSERSTPTGKGPSFRDTFDQIAKSDLTKAPSAALAGQLSGLKFSQHATDRMRSRGIAMTPEDMTRLQGAVEKAEKKGSKDSLVLMGDSAFVVSVKNKTVVTVMDKNMMKDNVFTNIDSTILL